MVVLFFCLCLCLDLHVPAHWWIKINITYTWGRWGAALQWRHWTEVKTTLPCWRYTRYEQRVGKSAKMRRLLHHLRHLLCADRCISLARGSLQADRKFTTSQCCNVVYLQHGGGNYCWQNDVTVTTCITANYDFFLYHCGLACSRFSIILQPDATLSVANAPAQSGGQNRVYPRQ